MADGGLCELLVDGRCDQLRHGSDAEDLFSILETWEECMNGGPGAAAAAEFNSQNCTGGSVAAGGGGATRPTTMMGNSQRRRRSSVADEANRDGGAPVQKKQKGTAAPDRDDDGATKRSHIAVERNRRKQMNEHLAVLHSLMPRFYVKRVSLEGLPAKFCTIFTHICHLASFHLAVIISW
jgi:transcription factor SPEECHLESS